MIIRFYQRIFSQMKFNGKLQDRSFQVFIERYLLWISAQFSSDPWGPPLSGWWTSQYLEMRTKRSAKHLNQYYNNRNQNTWHLWVVLPAHVIMRSHTNNIEYKQMEISWLSFGSQITEAQCHKTDRLIKWAPSVSLFWQAFWMHRVKR